jgi:hypothetical protein
LGYLVPYFEEKAERDDGKYQTLIDQHLDETLRKNHNLRQIAASFVDSLHLWW